MDRPFRYAGFGRPRSTVDDVQGHAIKLKGTQEPSDESQRFENDETGDVEGQTIRISGRPQSQRTDSETTDVEGHNFKHGPTQAPDIEGHGFHFANEEPTDEDAEPKTDRDDEPDLEGQGFRV